MIAAIILAAGQSKRMGQPKMLLPWGKTTVIEQVVGTFLQAGPEPIVVVTGGTREKVEQAIHNYPVRIVQNSEYATGEMLSSLQCGLRALPASVKAVLIGLGDQPQIQQEHVRLLCQKYQTSRSKLIVPSFRLRRGHPWLVERSYWEEILALTPPLSPRDFLNQHASEIDYLTIDTDGVLADLDTPEDYERSRPKE